MGRLCAPASRVLAGVVLGCLALLLSTSGLFAQEPPALAPLSGRFPARGITPETALTQLSVEQGDDGADPIVVVRFAAGFALPPDNYRISASVGDPTAQRVRASLVVEAGSVSGRLERGDGAVWEALGNTRASFDGDAGVARIEIPADLVADGHAVFAQVEVNGAIAAGTPYFDWAELRGETEGAVLGVSEFGLVTDNQLVPTGDVVQQGDGPRLEYVNGNIIVSFPSPPPTDIRGNPAVSVIDYLRVGSEPVAGGLPPFYVTIDHSRRQTVLWSGADGLPVPVSVDPATWIVEDFPVVDPTAEPVPAPEIVLSLAGLSQAVGVASDDATLGLGLARSVALVDGRIVTFDGVSGLIDWFEGSAAATLPPIEEDIAELEAPTTAAQPAASSEGGSSAPWIIAGIVVALGVVGLVIWAVRRQTEDHDEFTRIGTAGPERRAPAAAEAASASDDRPRPQRAAGVSPDEALAALQRTVEEVTSRLDETATERPKVKVPDGPDAVVDRRATPPPGSPKGGPSGPAA